MRKKSIFFLLLFVALPLSVGAGYLLFERYNAPTEQLYAFTGEERLFTVRRGESFNSVVTRLESGGFIRSALLLRVWAKVTRTDAAIKAGRYRIEPGSATDIVAQLSAGEQILVSVPLPEGLTITAFATRLEEAGICAAEEFIAACRDPALLDRFRIAGESAEGFLFPSTYRFPYEFGGEKTVEKLISTFYEKLDVIAPEARNLPTEELYEKVILASIVEKEYRVPDEAPLIASVFTNRLDNGQRLESCATIVYIKTEIFGEPHPKRILFRDLEVDSPYNTYTNPYLPPGPIANPGEVALDAAFSPAETDYFFFVVNDITTGTSTFSTTYDEHLNASQGYYQEIEGIAPMDRVVRVYDEQS